MYLWAGERIYGQFRKTKPWFRAAEYAKSFFANFKIKTDECIYGRMNVSMDNLGKQNHGSMPLSMLKASLLTLK